MDFKVNAKNEKKLKKWTALKTADNELMGSKNRSVRYPEWMKNAVAAFAKKNGFESESKAFIWLLGSQLNSYGYFEADYTAHIVDKPLEPQAGDKKEKTA